MQLILKKMKQNEENINFFTTWFCFSATYYEKNKLIPLK